MRDEKMTRKELDAHIASRIEREIRHLKQKARRITHEDKQNEWEVQEENLNNEELQQEGYYTDTKKKKSKSWLSKIFSGYEFAVSGNILTNETVAKYYKHLFVLALLFFANIVVMFYALHLDMTHNKLRRETQLKRERSIRLKEQSADISSHSGVVRELRKRGIELYDTTTPITIIKE